MDLNQFLLALKARRKVFALVLAATVLTALAVVLIVPNTYLASTTVLIDNRDEQAMTSTAAMSPRDRTGYIQTQVDMVTSGRVARKVARDLKLSQAPGMREEFERDTGGVGSIDDWIANGLLKHLKVDTG